MLIWPIKGHFWCLVVNLVPFSSNLGNLKEFLKIQQKDKQIQKIQNQTKIKKVQKKI